MSRGLPKAGAWLACSVERWSDYLTPEHLLRLLVVMTLLKQFYIRFYGAFHVESQLIKVEFSSEVCFSVVFWVLDFSPICQMSGTSKRETLPYVFIHHQYNPGNLKPGLPSEE
jgi:hypothetical protein